MTSEEVGITAEEKWTLIRSRIPADQGISAYLDVHNASSLQIAVPSDTGTFSDVHILSRWKTIPKTENLNPRKKTLSRSHSSETVHEISRNGISYDLHAFADMYEIEGHFLEEYITKHLKVSNMKEFCVQPRVETYLRLSRMLSPYKCKFAEKQLIEALCFLSSNNSPDSQLVVEILKTIELDFFQKILTLEVDNSVTEYLLHHAKKMNFDFKDCMEFDSFFDNRYALYRSIFTKAVDRVKTLLNYGLQREFTEAMLDRFIILLDFKLSGELERTSDLEYVFGDVFQLREEKRYKWNNISGRRCILALETLSILMMRAHTKSDFSTSNWRTLSRSDSMYEKGQKYRMFHPIVRPQISYLTISTTYVDSGGKGRDAPEMINLIWRSVPDPFVPHVEMYSILESLLPRRHADRLEVLCDVYKKSGCDGSDAPASPRSLAQLCRCAVRGLLLQNDQLPEGIDSLKLPQHLKSYLLLKK